MNVVGDSKNVLYHTGIDKDRKFENKRTIFANPDNVKNALRYAVLRNKLKRFLNMMMYYNPRDNQNQKQILKANLQSSGHGNRHGRWEIVYRYS